MVKPWLCAVLLSLSLLSASVPAGAQQEATPPSDTVVAISGAVAKPTQWTYKQLQDQFTTTAKRVTYILKEKSHYATCVPLQDLLRISAARPTDPKRKHGELSLVVTVVGEDGYAAAFSFGELSPEYGKATVYVALDRDEKPLLGKDGPVELLVISDGKPSRWVHGVRQIRVIDIAVPKP